MNNDVRLLLTKQFTILNADSDPAARHDVLCHITRLIAHEVNQPLSGVRNLAEHILLAQQRGAPLSVESMQEKLHLVIEQVDKISRLLDHINSLAHAIDCSDDNRKERSR